MWVDPVKEVYRKPVNASEILLRVDVKAANKCQNLVPALFFSPPAGGGTTPESGTF